MADDFTATPQAGEEQAETDNDAPRWDPWSGPSKPAWYAGLGYDDELPGLGPLGGPLTGAAIGASKLEASVAGGISAAAGAVGAKGVSDYFQQQQDDAREVAKGLLPDPSTTGAAADILRSVAEGGYLMATGAALGGAPGAAAVVGGTEGPNRYMDLKEQGVDTRTAAEAGAVTGITSAAGAVMPAAIGETLLTRVATGAGFNTAFGMINRFADHMILEHGGYPEMAAQQKVWDTSQVLVDLALGATFGIVHHLSAEDEVAAKALQTPDNRDAALTANLSLRDRQAAPGVPVDPESANAHQSAMEKAVEDVAAGRPVDVSDSGVLDGSYLSRPDRDFTPEQKILLDTFRESGLLDEEANLRDLESMLEDKQQQPSPRRSEAMPEAGTPEAAPSPTDPVAAALQDRPGLRLPDEDGVIIRAQDRLDRFPEEQASADEFGKAAQAAVTCFGRMGG